MSNTSKSNNVPVNSVSGCIARALVTGCFVLLLGACGGGGATSESADVVPESDPQTPEVPVVAADGHRVIILTDVNNAGGDPDDKQSLVHLLWYADELDIRGIIPDYWNGDGYNAALESVGVYEQDYANYDMAAKGYPAPDTIRSRIVSNEQSAIDMLIREAKAASDPLYVLVWGDMDTLRKALYQDPDIQWRLRVLTIATDRKYGDPNNCADPNWNAAGRNAIFDDTRFTNLWWVESNWTYNGMFDGDRPRQMLVDMASYGAMGWYMRHAVRDFSWAQYFRAGDTPTVLYMIDPEGVRDDPTRVSWAGQFARPFPNKRPNYYTDASSGFDWNYEDPCASWWLMDRMYDYSKSTLGWKRDNMYDALLEKLNRVYNR